MFFLRKSSLYSKQNKISCSDKSNQADNERNLSYHIQASSDHNIYITGRIIISKGECFTSQISLSAIILTLLEASMEISSSTEARVTFIPALRRTSVMITASISSDPFAIGTKTCQGKNGNPSIIYLRLEEN